MPLYMDMHKFAEITIEDVKKAHVADNPYRIDMAVGLTLASCASQVRFTASVYF